MSADGKGAFPMAFSPQCCIMWAAKAHGSKVPGTAAGPHRKRHPRRNELRAGAVPSCMALARDSPLENLESPALSLLVKDSLDQGRKMGVSEKLGQFAFSPKPFW